MHATMPEAIAAQEIGATSGMGERLLIEPGIGDVLATLRFEGIGPVFHLGLGAVGLLVMLLSLAEAASPRRVP
ncbi:hypothetical protein BGI51_07640 [Pseudomonas oryzihabitans]|nr:hypothetical protein BGI51_07640 [Pseudomonas psychrotolerans]